MNKKPLIIISTLLFLLLFVSYFNLISLNAQSNNKETGRYQVTSCSRENGNWIFITIIDTQTGEIVKQESYHGSGDFYKNKED